MLPFHYAVRNLTRSLSRTAQMIAGSAMVVLLLLNAAAFNRGIDKTLAATGDPKNIILLAAGSEESAERSQISAAIPGIVAASVKGIRRNLGMAAVSPEIHHLGLVKKNREDFVDREILFRGVELNALLVHRKVAIQEGSFPDPGELLVGRQAARVLGLTDTDIAVGKILLIEDVPYTVAGVFDAPGTVLEAEIWLPLSDLKTLTRRDNISCCVVALDQADYADFTLFCRQRLDLELAAVPETEFYGNLITYYRPIKTMTWLVAILISLGAMFGGLNTMYAAYISRIRELATLQAIGYSRFAILISLLQEALLTCLLGTVLAMAVSLFLLDGISVPFATGVFFLQYDTENLLLALAAGIGLGVIGIIAPAWNCLKPGIVQCLRS